MKSKIIFVALLSASGVAQANDVTRFSNDPDNGRAYIDVSGNTHVIDFASQQVIITDANGQTQLVPFSEIADEVGEKVGLPPDQAMLFIQDTLINRDFTMTQTNSTTPRPVQQRDSGGGGGGYIIQGSGKNKSGGQITASTYSTTGGPCDLSPCTPYIRHGDNRIFYMRDAWSGTSYAGAVTQQQRFADDFRNWQRHRNDACQDMRDNMAAGALAGVGIAVTCPAVMTGVGAVACAISVVAFVHQQRLVARDARDCQSKYPGPGKW